MKWVTRQRPKVDRIGAGVRTYDPAKRGPALPHLALVVGGAETRQRKLTPESRGLLATARCSPQAYGNDQEQLAAELPAYGALYAWCGRQEDLG